MSRVSNDTVVFRLGIWVFVGLFSAVWVVWRAIEWILDGGGVERERRKGRVGREAEGGGSFPVCMAVVHSDIINRKQENGAKNRAMSQKRVSTDPGNGAT